MVATFQVAGLKTSFKVVKKKSGDGWIISLPSRKKEDGTWENIADFVNREARQAAEAVVGAYLTGDDETVQVDTPKRKDKPASAVSVNTSGIGVAGIPGIPKRPSF